MHQRKRKNRRILCKASVLLASFALLLCTCVGGTLAWLVAGGGSLVNTFEPGWVSSAVLETWPNGGVKENVRVKNTGNTDAYIRAYVSVCWKNEKNEIYKTAPVLGADYTMSDYNRTDWVQIGSYWYHRKSVAPGAETAALFTSCQYLNNAPEGYSLSVEIIADAIQSKPVAAVEDSWKVSVAAGEIGGPKP